MGLADIQKAAFGEKALTRLLTAKEAYDLFDAAVEAYQALLQRVAALERRLADAEGAGLRYRGIWKADAAYVPGDFCTDRGSLWACLTKAIGVRPGTGGAWQLAVKRGQDAKP